MSGERGRFEEEEGPTCKQCTRVYCLEASLNDALKRLETVTKTLDVVLERLNAVEGSRIQEEGERQRWMGTARPRAWKTQRKGLKRRRSRNKERQRPTKGRTGYCWLHGDSLVWHVGRNLEQQCVGINTVCKPGGRIEQIVPEIEKRGDKEEAVIVQVGTNNLRMEEMMKKYEEMIQRLKEERLGEVVVMGILPR